MKLKQMIVGLILTGGFFTLYVNYTMNVTKKGFLKAQLLEIESKIEDRDVLNEEISKVSVAWHLDHSLKVINRIYEALAASDPKTFESSVNFSRVASLTFNYIPRGRAQSPKAVLPPDTITLENLYLQLEEAKRNIDKVFELDENTHFEHPVFGTIARGHSLRFIEVHTEHHLKIMRDILEE